MHVRPEAPDTRKILPVWRSPNRPSQGFRLPDLLWLPVAVVEVLELRAQDGALVEFRLAVYAEEDFFWAAWMQIILQHEIEKLPTAFPDLIHELRKRYSSRYQTLASLAWFQISKPAIGVPYDEPRHDVLGLYSLLRHCGPFLAS